MKLVLAALGIPDVPIKFSREYQFDEYLILTIKKKFFFSKFTLDVYRMVSVITRDQTALVEGGNTVGCHLCPVYFALDIQQANPDIVNHKQINYQTNINY